MPEFKVDEDIAALVWQLAKPKPFENLTFSAALRRILRVPNQLAGVSESGVESLFPSKPEPKKAPSPSPTEWAMTIPELKGRKGLNTWKAICNFLKIDTAGDSARRKLKNWVKLHRPMWPSVPDID